MSERQEGQGAGSQRDIRFACPRCGQHVEAEPDMRGERWPCPGCGAQVEVPARSTLAAKTPRSGITRISVPPLNPSPGGPRPELIAAALSDVGRQRPRNEDAVLCLPAEGIFAVADGMGGLEDGTEASALVVESLREEFAPRDKGRRTVRRLPIRARAARVLNHASRAVHRRAAERGVMSGSTAVVLVFDDSRRDRAWVLHVGDSRAYCFRGGELKRLTTDHTLAGMLGADEQSIPDQLRYRITRAIGTREAVEVDVAPVDVRERDLFLLCSDGLTTMVPDGRIEDELLAYDRERGGLKRLAGRLVHLANEAGGRDNVSMVLVRVGGEAGGAAGG